MMHNNHFNLYLQKSPFNLKCVTRSLPTQNFHLKPNSHTQTSQSQNIGPYLSNLTLSNITQAITQSHNFTQSDVGGGHLGVSELICRQAWCLDIMYNNVESNLELKGARLMVNEMAHATLFLASASHATILLLTVDSLQTRYLILHLYVVDKCHCYQRTCGPCKLIGLY